MSQAINADHVSGNNNNPNNSNNSNSNNNPPTISQATDLSTKDKFRIIASQVKNKTKESAQKIATQSKDRLSLEGQLKQARISLQRYINPKILDKQIKEDTLLPKWVLKKAKGIVFLTVLKAGFLFAGNVGTGCVIVRKPNGGWTGPSSIMVAGVSFGFLAGASKVDYIMILPDDAAVKQFTGNGQLRLGGEIQVALGPVGREGSGSVGAGDKGVSVIFSYSHAQGIYGGLALDGKVISVRPDCNDKFYKKKVTCFEILTGIFEPPLNEDYDMIVHLLDSYCNDDLTPLKGERISIDDLDRQTNNGDFKQNEPGSHNINNNDNNDDNSKNNNDDNNNNNNGLQFDDIGQKFAIGFNNFKSKIFSKNDSNNTQQSKQNSNNNVNNANNNNNNLNNNNNNASILDDIMGSAEQDNNNNDNNKNNNMSHLNAYADDDGVDV